MLLLGARFPLHLKRFIREPALLSGVQTGVSAPALSCVASRRTRQRTELALPAGDLQGHGFLAHRVGADAVGPRAPGVRLLSPPFF